jgi:hypothetical protein
VSSRDLSTVIADWRGEAAVLRRRGETKTAVILEQCAEEAATASESYLLWLSETDAMLRTGRARDWLRARYEGWAAEGHARKIGRDRQYRAIMLPRRAAVIEAREAGRQAARAVREAA